MEDQNDELNRLLSKLEILLVRQENFSREIDQLRKEIKMFKIKADLDSAENETKKSQPTQPKPEATEHQQIQRSSIENQPIGKPRVTPPKVATEPVPVLRAKATQEASIKTNIEKFIGENLINKIGIAITVIGVAIGAKYAIDHRLISPLTRIILGYLIGIGLMGFAIRLKKNYENFSTVLLSGSMAILYFITYAAYSFYNLIPQPVAFGMMVIFTAFTVMAALNFNRQIIAHIGLVGAYAVPFLLSNGSHQVVILFTYMCIINAGILIISFKKYWKGLLHSAFWLSWLIFFIWYVTDYNNYKNFSTALIFLTLFFLIFYTCIMAYKLIRKEKFNTGDVILIFANSFIFYGIGYGILSTDSTEVFLGLFTLGNAIVHFIVSTVIYRQKLADRNLFFLVSGLVLTFITIAIPVQLNGHWVTLLWIAEAAVVFWIGRTRKVPFYEKLSYPLMALAFISLIQDWEIFYNIHNFTPQTHFTPVFNINFLNSLLFIAGLSFILVVERNKKYTSPVKDDYLQKMITYSIFAVLIITIYYSIAMEISTYWQQLYENSFLQINGGQPGMRYYNNADLPYFQTIWLILYSMLFVAILSFVNLRFIKNKILGYVNVVLNAIVILVFLIVGLFYFSLLRFNYLNQTLGEYYHIGIYNIVIRYISLPFIALSLIMIYRQIKKDYFDVKFKAAFDLFLHITIIWFASSELINWMDIAHSTQSYKLGLSILWGSYSLLLIILGIWKNKKHLRIGAISLFGITLIKLFTYDISYLDTISKTILFVLLGVLLLIISFLYNKYKHLIFNENES